LSEESSDLDKVEYLKNEGDEKVEVFGTQV
jgi:hypothetical protein